ncbi:MAG TPA: group II intron reverse transcriptase/maturase [Syntrophomonas sp.]|nr:group II intron reverse transcriptase/maturase [Syntrophomonas sp.]
METKLKQIADKAKSNPQERFTSLIHLINDEMLITSFYELKAKKAAGVDRVTKAMYQEHLEENIADLLRRMKANQYKPQPVKRVYIPKTGNKSKRPLGIPALEDKLVQIAISKILSAIYEKDFLANSYGFRPNRGCHDALRALHEILSRKKANFIVDADITAFFDRVDHKWMMRCLEVRIRDTKLLRLIARILKAGIMEDNQYHASPEGTPQGGNLSPLLANIYLHYALDLWFEKVVKKHLKGECYMVRYADDFVCAFQDWKEAHKVYAALEKRLSKFSLEISQEKSKILEFGKYAAENRQKVGKGKPETFDFLGFTHYCSIDHNGKFRVKRKTSRKKFRNSLQRVNEWAKRNRNVRAVALLKSLKAKLIGYYRYYGITDNIQMVRKFYHRVRQIIHYWLNRRSQRKSYNWENFDMLWDKMRMPTPKIYISIFS